MTRLKRQAGRSPIDDYYMPPLSSETLDEEALERLAGAVVKCAADDYVAEIKAGLQSKAYAANGASVLNKLSIEAFFRSKWYRMLVNDQINGEWMIKALQRKAEEEYADEQKTGHN